MSSPPWLRRARRSSGGHTVLFLCHSAKPSGAELALLRLAARMTSRPSPGRVVVVFAEDGPLVAEFRRAGVQAEVVVATTGALATRRGARFTTVAGGVLRLVGYGRQVARWADDHGVTVVVARSSKAMLYGSVAARSIGVPLVWSVHDRIAGDYLGRLPATAVRTAGRFLPDAYVVNSRSTLSTIRTGTKPVLLTPPALDPAPSGAPELHRPDGDLDHVVMTGRLAPWKGQHVFLEAFTRVFAGTATRATVVGGALFGETAYEAELHRGVAAGPCADQISFTGHVGDVAPYLRSADVAVHASVIPEPFGLVVVEGMAAGCAVVATVPGGPSEVVTDGITGLLVPCDDVDAMEAALRRLLADPALRHALGRAAIHRAREYDVVSAATMTSPWLERVALRTALPALLSGIPAERSIPGRALGGRSQTYVRRRRSSFRTGPEKP